MSSKDSPILEVRNLSWTPDDADQPLWAEASLEIASGETVVLEGPSGSGKSTLLRSIVYLESPSSGDVFWRGDQVTTGNIRRFRHDVVYVHQTPVPIAPTVEQNLAFPRQMAREFTSSSAKPLSEKDQDELLERFGLPGLDKSRRFDELSVGEQQRLALVRCLSVAPQMLLLDEPTASLDEKNACLIEEHIADYVSRGEGRAALWVSHSRDQIARLGGRRIDLAEIAVLNNSV